MAREPRQPVQFPGAPPNSAFALDAVPGLLGVTPGGSGIAIVATDNGGRGIAGFSGSSGSLRSRPRLDVRWRAAVAARGQDAGERVTGGRAADAKGDLDRQAQRYAALCCESPRHALGLLSVKRQVLFAHGVGPIVRRGVIDGLPGSGRRGRAYRQRRRERRRRGQRADKGRVHVAGYQSRLFIR